MAAMVEKYAVDPDVADKLEQSDPELLAEMRAKYEAELDKLYPKPELADIQEFYSAQYAMLLPWRRQVQQERERRYRQDTLPQKWQKDLKDGRRVFTNLTHNEIMRVVAAQTSNAPLIHIPPKSDSAADLKASQKETRWANQLLGYIERGSDKPVRRRWVDAQNEDGFAALEWYLTDAYDDLATEPRMIMDRKSQVYRQETASEVNRRLERSLIGKRPFGVRFVDGLNAYVEEDEEGTCRAVIVERKPRKQVYQALRRRGINWEADDDPSLPQRADGLAWPDDMGGGTAGVPTVQTIRYYDRRWVAYIVDGRWAEEPKEHKLPGCPVFPLYGMVTSSPNPEQQVQGICSGLGSIETALNDMLTLGMDEMFRYSRPKFVVTTPADGQLMLEGRTNRPEVLDLSGEGVRQLNPGQQLINVLQGFVPFLQMPLLQTLMNFWGRSTRNPVSQGESPGASPAGYTVSALQLASEEVYVDNLRNEEVTYGRVVDFTRQAIKYPIGEATYLPAAVGEGPKGRVEWLGLGPDDVSDVPAIAFIDPDTPASKMSKRQSLMQGNKEGFLPRRIVQTEGYGADDPKAWDDEIVVDEGEQSLMQWAIEDAQRRVQMIRQQQTGIPGGQPGAADIGGQAAVGGVPAAPQAPSVGGAMAAASAQPFQTAPGPAAMPAGAAMGGQSNGYVPPPEQR